MSNQKSLRQITRSPEGEISRGEFVYGALVVAALSLFGLGIVMAIAKLSQTMEWMTVAVVPFLGVALFIVVTSLCYFWFCLFIKRMRGMKQPIFGAYGWLFSLLAGCIFALLAFEDASFGLFGEQNLLSHSGAVATLFFFVSALLFFILLGAGLFGPDGDAGKGSCDL